MKTILCCTDGSLYAPSVYDHTIWAARRTNAEVLVLHMLDPQRDVSAVHDFSGNLEPDEGDELMKEMVALEEAKSKVANAKGRVMLKAAHQHFEAAGMPDIRAEQRHGTLVETLEKVDRDFVVIAKRGENADFARMHLGANLERVIRSSRRPVLVASRAFQDIDRWVLAFEGSPSAHKAVAFAASQPLLRGLPCPGAAVPVGLRARSPAAGRNPLGGDAWGRFDLTGCHISCKREHALYPLFLLPLGLVIPVRASVRSHGIMGEGSDSGDWISFPGGK